MRLQSRLHPTYMPATIIDSDSTLGNLFGSFMAVSHGRQMPIPSIEYAAMPKKIGTPLQLTS